ncbi:hypothetical protein [Rhizobium leguminosarum]
MSVPSTEFRSITVQARKLIGPGGPPLWKADVVVGMLNRPGEQDPPKGPDRDVFRAASVRVVTQDIDPVAINVNGAKVAGYHAPRLLQAALRARDVKSDPGGGLSLLTACGGGPSPRQAGTAELDPRLQAPDTNRYSDVLIGLNDTITRKQGVQIELPEATLEGGAVAALLRIDTGGLARWLGITAAFDKIFGPKSIFEISTEKIGAARYLPVWLVPDGLEFNVRFPDPFPGLGASLTLRLLLTYDAELAQFTARPRALAPGHPHASKLRVSFDRLVADFGGKGTPLLAEVDPRGLPFAWALGHGASGQPLTTTGSDLYIDRVAVRARLNSGNPGDAAAPTVCQLQVKTAGIDIAARKLTLLCEPGASAVSAATDELMTATLIWEDKAPPNATLLPGSRAKQFVETARFGRELRERYLAAGLDIAPGATLYAFLPLERGMLQLPLPSHADTKEPAPTPRINRSAFSGLVRSAVPISDNQDAALLEIAAAISATILVEIGRTTKTTATFTGSRGTVRGLVFAAAASPSPTSILPPLDAGPIACQPLDIVFGDPEPNIELSVKTWDFVTEGKKRKRLNVTLSLPETAGDAIVWQPHPRMPLVSTMPMTRTRFDATRPSTTRDLVPFTVATGTARDFSLNTNIESASRSPFPELERLAGLATNRHPRWPWPSFDKDEPDAGEGNDALSNVSASILTLAGVEVTLPGNDWNGIRASLRYDLPLLGELFASSTLPKSGAAGSPSAVLEFAPTALDLQALSRHWALTANRHALSRTINDRATEWLAPGGAAQVKAMTTFVEPYSFASNFRVATDASGLPMGSYSLFGTTVAGSAALAGWSGTLKSQQGESFEIAGFSTRVSDGVAEGVPAQFDTRGMGAALLPAARKLLPDGLLEMRSIARRDANPKTAEVTQTDRVSVTVSHIQFQLAGLACGLRLRDLPMEIAANGNLLFSPTVEQDHIRKLTGPEGEVGPDGSIFERRYLQDAVYEWSFYSATKGENPSFVVRLGALDVRPLRLTQVAFRSEKDGIKLQSFEVIANIEPSTPKTGQGPIDDDAPYETGNAVAMTFAIDVDGKIATLIALNSVTVENRSILIGASANAVVNFAATAKLLYGAADKPPADGIPSQGNSRLPIVLEMTLAASGDPAAPVKIISSALNAVLFGSSTRFSFTLASTVQVPDALSFIYEEAVTASLLQVQRVALIWEQGARPVVTISARLRMPGDDAPSPGATRNLVEWDVGATMRWFGTKVAHKSLTPGDDHFSFGVDHDKGTISLDLSIKALAAEAEFIKGWPVVGAPFTLAIAAAFPALSATETFVSAPSAGFVEATCGPFEGAFIRHRTTLVSPPGKIADRKIVSRILVTLPDSSRTSAIAWPITGLSAPTATIPFAPNPRKAADWRQDLVVAAAQSHAHKVTVAVRDAELPASNLVEVSGSIVLGAPWTFPAIVTHGFDNAGSSATWTSIDEVIVGHRSALEREARETIADPPGDLAFAARYRGSLAPASQDYSISAGVFSKAMARAGIPTIEMLLSMQAMVLQEQQTPGAGKAPVKSDLFISGAAVIEVAAGNDDSFGHRVVTPWIAPLFDAAALGVLGTIPQAPWTGKVSTYDLAAYNGGWLDGEAAIPFSTSNPSIAWINDYRHRIAGMLPEQRVPDFEPVSQAVIDDVALPIDAADPFIWLRRPIWLRTLSAWKGILAGTSSRPLADRITTVLPVLVGEKGASRSTALRLKLQRPLDAEPVGIMRLPSDVSTQSDLSYEVLVVTRHGVSLVEVSNDQARTLSQSGQSIVGDARSRLAHLALSSPDEPLLAALGAVTDVASDLLDEHQLLARTHRVITLLNLPAGLDAVAQSHRLRPRTRTIFTSPAVSWPRPATRARWKDEHPEASLALGDQRPLQDAEASWAGDVRSFSVMGAAPAPDGVFRQASVLMTGQRALFRRPTDEDLTAPPDRALIPVAARTRVPSSRTVEESLASFRLRRPDKEPEAGIAAIQPSHFEVVTTGRRPGVLFFQYDGMSFVEGEQSFDAAQPRFGRPADRGPTVFRQTRAPRSTAYRPLSNLTARRQTFIGTDYVDEAEQLAPFVVAKGPMTALRILNDDELLPDVETILLRLAKTAGAVQPISPNWDGKIQLAATAFAAGPAIPIASKAVVERLLAVGLTGSDTKIALIVDGKQILFEKPVVGVPVLNTSFEPHGNPLRWAFDIPIILSTTVASATLARELLQSTGPDSRVFLSFSFPALNAQIGCAQSDLLPGPPRLLSIPVPLVAGRAPSLRMETATLAFGDPAYDREIASKTASLSQQTDGKSYLLALDRPEYDITSTIYFAAGQIIKTTSVDSEGKDPVWAAPDQMTLQLQLFRKHEEPANTSPLLVVAGRPTLDVVHQPRHRFCSGSPYAIALSDLLEVVPNSKDRLEEGYTVRAPMPAIAPGDRIAVTAIGSGGTLEVAVTVTPDPVLSPPAAVYGLATLDTDEAGGKRLTSSLFSAAPLPQIVEFQDLGGDLAKGLVRRRALFVWPFDMRTVPIIAKAYAALVKVDRTGGGQTPDTVKDFRPLLM